MDETTEPTPGNEPWRPSNAPGESATAMNDPRMPDAPGGRPEVLDPSLAAQPTAQIPVQPTQQLPVQSPGQGWAQPGQHGSGALGWASFGVTPPGAAAPPTGAGPPTGAAPPTGTTPPGAAPPGQPPAGGAPPYSVPGFGGSGPYHPGQGYWGHAPWAGTAPAWGWTGSAPAGSRRANSPLLMAIVVAAVVVAAVAGVVIGHAVWSNTSLSSQGSSSPIVNPGAGTSPFGSGNSGNGTTPFGSGNSGSGQGSSAAGGPADAASIANNVDPGLVDVNTTLTYQGLEGAGTGMVLTPGGEILTNNHVIEGETSISVTDIGNGRTYSANVVGYDRSQDVAVLQLVGASGLQTVSTGDSSKVKVGEGVVAIGNANGAGGTPSYAGGSVTATDQSITASDEADGTSEELSGLIETNADIISGDSGGPLVDSSGQVIGMDTAGSGESGGFQFESPANEGYAIPINDALSTARQIEAGNASSTVHLGPTAFLGVEVAASASDCQSSGPFGGLGGGGTSPSTPGAYVCEAVSGDPASQAGISAGDTITSVDGHDVTSADSLTDVMLGEVPGRTISVQYVDSSGQQRTTSVTLGTGPPQ